MALKKLYPPEIEGVIPAFYGTALVVPFSMNKTVSKSEISGMIIKIKTVFSNQYLGYAKTYFNGATQENLDRVSFDLSGFIDKLNIGQYYKIQIAYLSVENDNGKTKEVIGYYSTVGVVKYTALPEVSIDNLNINIINSHCYNYIGIYNIPSYEIDGKIYYDINEKEYSHHFIISDSQGNIIYQTEEIIHNGLNDDTEELYKQFDNFEYLNDLTYSKIFFIQYIVTTVNKMVISSPKYRIVQRSSIDPELEASIKVNLNFDNGYIDINLVGVKDKYSGIENVATGSFKLVRTDNTSDFTSWREILKFALYGQQPSTWSWRDCTIEQGIEYIYAIQQYNDSGLISNRLESEKIYADFEDAFLFDGKRQLKIRFNPKISSFKTDLLETKIETIGSKYPFIFRNGNVSYKEFSISGLISYKVDEEKLFMDYKDLEFPSTNLVSENLSLERQFKLEVLNWLNNGEPKLFRSPSEGNYIVRLINTSLSPNDTLGRMLHTFSSTAYEIADFTYENLSNYGIINVIDPTQTQVRWETVNFEEFIQVEANDGSYTLVPGTYNPDYNWLRHFPATSLRFEGMIPGDRIHLDDGVQRADGIGFDITIGTTGTYMVDDNIKIYSVKFLNYTDIPIESATTIGRNHQGTLTYSYESKSVNKFDTISNFEINDIPVRQFIGKTEILNGITDVRKQIEKVFFLHSKVREIQKVEQDDNGILHYKDGQEIEPNIFDLYEIYHNYNTPSYYIAWEKEKDSMGNFKLDPSIKGTGYLYHYVYVYPSDLDKYSEYKKYDKNILINEKGEFYYEDNNNYLLHPTEYFLYPVVTKNYPVAYAIYNGVNYIHIPLTEIYNQDITGKILYNSKKCNTLTIYQNVNKKIESQKIDLSEIESYEILDLNNITEIAQEYGIISELAYQEKIIQYAIESNPEYFNLINTKLKYKKAVDAYYGFIESYKGEGNEEIPWEEYDTELAKLKFNIDEAYKNYIEELEKALKDWEEANGK